MKQILYAMLYMLTTYMFMYSLFQDVFTHKPLAFSSKDIVYLLLFGMLFMIASYMFFKNTLSTLSHKTALTLLLSSALFALILQKNVISGEKGIAGNSDLFTNPLYQTYTALAKKYDLDLSFTRKVWEQRGPRDYKVNDIFRQKPKSVDILFLGDSAIAWGLIPQVIEQMTDKKVAMYAYEANVFTTATIALYNKLAHYYLKEDGIVILSFDNRNKARNPDLVSMSVRQYREIMQWKDKDFRAYANEINPTFYEKYISYEAFVKQYEQYTAYLQQNYGLELKSPSLYSEYVEQYVNPILYKAKQTNKNKETKFLRWDSRTITEYNPNFKNLSLPNKEKPVEPFVHAHTKQNARSAQKIYAKEKIYMVNLYNNREAYLLSRNIYENYYKNLGFKLCDLGAMLKDNKHYIMQEDGSHPNALTHMGNEGGLMKSILTGKWLQSYYAKKKRNKL